MLGLTLALALLGAPAVGCPPAVGQIRWDGVSYTVRGAKQINITGTVWDRDRDGKPSHNDLMHIQSADPLGIDEAWVVLRGALAKDVGRRFKRMEGLTARCESRFEVKDVPKMGTPAALARHLNSLGGTGKVSNAERVRADMQGWADELCKQSKHTSGEALTKFLEDRGMRKHARHGKGLIRRTAHEVAEAFEVACAHFSVPKMTYD